MKRRLLSLLVIVLASAGGGLASAQVQGEAPYVSPMRAQCEDELSKDFAWQAIWKDQISYDRHDQDARLMLKNKKFVVAAYAVLWCLVVLFVAIMWFKQRNLMAEISALEDQLKRTAADDDRGASESRSEK